MKLKSLVLPLACSFILTGLKAQDTVADSLKLVKTFKELLTICRTVDFADPKVKELGLFYKAAPYVIYQGEDKNREWKDFANYKNEPERKGVDETCLRINGTVNRDQSYKIEGYLTKNESEGIWHVLLISYLKKGVTKKMIFAFLKIGDRFGLGDID